MLIRFTKSKHPTDPNRKRRSDTLTCVREDGSITASKFHATHDLTHYAVETVLDIPGSFYRLVADGLDIEAFTTPGAAKKLNVPYGAVLVETIVGLLETERASFVEYTPAEFNTHLAAMCRQQSLETYEVAATDLAQIRERLRDLFSQWSRIDPGETLTLAFPV